MSLLIVSHPDYDGIHVMDDTDPLDIAAYIVSSFCTEEVREGDEVIKWMQKLMDVCIERGKSQAMNELFGT